MTQDSTTVSNYDLDEVKSNFDLLLDNFQKKIKEFRPRSDIKKTKLWKYKKKLNDIDSLNSINKIKLMSIIIRYNSLNNLFNENISLSYSNKVFIKLVEGDAEYDDRDQEYNDTFFELSMAVRFLQPSKEKVNVNLLTDCDIVIDETLAIECKYLHSEKSAKERITEGIRQVQRRVEDGIAKIGIVSIDISFIFDDDKFNNLILSVFNDFYCNYKKTFDLDDYFLIKEIVLDRNFNKICSSLINHHSEFFIISLLSDDIYSKMTKEVLGITYQVQSQLMFQKEDILLPVPYRMMSYKLNPALSDEEQLSVKKLIHSLTHKI